MAKNDSILNTIDVDLSTTGHVTSTRVKHSTYQFQLGGVLRLCLATDKKEAMLVFGTRDANRVNRYVIDSSLAFDLFRPHDIVISDYDGRTILQFPLK